MGGMPLAQRAQVFLEGLGTFDSLEAIVNLACSLLGAPLLVCEAGGAILAISPPELRDCPAWLRMARCRRVEKELLKDALAPSSSPKVWAGLTGRGKACFYWAYPLPFEPGVAPGSLCVFSWLWDLTDEDRAFASLAAGALTTLIRRRFAAPGAAQSEKMRLLRELLNYKPGRKSDFERDIALENLKDLPGDFRVAYIPVQGGRGAGISGLTALAFRRLPGAWVFAHEDALICVFNEALVAPAFAAALEGFLRDESLSGCLSMGFTSLLSLRYACENARAAWRIGARKAPGAHLYRAEDYLFYSFLDKCQRYFPIEEHCPDAFGRLARYDLEKKRDSLATLQAYLDSGRNASATAKQLFIHRNTLAQRLEKIQEILGVSLDDPEVCLYLQLCLRIETLKRL